MALQTSPVASSIPPDAFAIDAPSRHHYAQQSPQLNDGYRSPNSAQSSRRPSRRPSGGNSSHPTTPQSTRSPNPTNSSSATVRALPIAPSSQPSPMSPHFPTSNPLSHQTGNAEQDGARGPQMSPPARTSSNQPSSSSTGISSLPMTDRTRRENASRNTPKDAPREEIPSDREMALGASGRRWVPLSPDQAGIASSPRNARAHPSAARKSESNVQSPSRPDYSREGSQVINRVVVTDPQVDIARETERLAATAVGTAAPTSSAVNAKPNGVGVDDSNEEGSRRTRQDFSSTSKRKETKFGEYILGQTLGEGEFGKVKLGWKRDGSVQVAIKLIRRENLSTNPSRLPKIHREIAILGELSHPNIVRLHEMVETDHHIGIILEYASGGELFDYILTNRFLKDHAARRLFAQLVSGVGYLHKKGIVHRDLKLENLLLDRNRNIIITDFGFANTFNPRDELGDDIEYNLTNKDFVKKMELDRVVNGFRRGDLMQTSCGSPCYAAPELVVTESLYTGRKVDVWSCGVILYAMLAGYLPFDDDPANPEGDNINLLYKYIVSTPLTFPEYVTPHARDLLRRILVPDPRKRADLFEVARHSWLSEYAHVVSHITSSTTTVGDISNTTVTSEHIDAPLLARSASVREPTKPHSSNATAVGGLSHSGKIDQGQEQKSKDKKTSNRRTVQVEYVAPPTQTIRGEASPPQLPTSPASQTRSGSLGPISVPAARKQSASATTRKPLPQEPHTEDPTVSRDSKASLSPYATQRQSTSPSMLPPTRPGREARATSESTAAFMPAGASITRPNTGGSMSSTGGRLPSQGNPYSQVAPPTLAATNAQGRLAQPKKTRNMTISAPIPHPEPYMSDASYTRPTSQRIAPRQPIASDAQGKTHKRSTTLTNVFQRSSSLFSGKGQSPVEHGRPQVERRYPPTSMKVPIISSSPRQSSESRRPSFGFTRKNSDLSQMEKPKRFSLLPSSFSFKNFGAAKSSDPQARNYLERKPSFGQVPQSRRHGGGRSPSIGENENGSYNGPRDPQRHVSAPLSAVPSRQEIPSRAPSSQALPEHERVDRYHASPSQSHPGYSSPTYPDGNDTMPGAGANGSRRPMYPAGFNSFDDLPKQTVPQGRTSTSRGSVLTKANRRFADAFEQDQDSGHAGSSGAAKRVMDFFRRRGKARSGDDR